MVAIAVSCNITISVVHVSHIQSIKHIRVYSHVMFSVLALHTFFFYKESPVFLSWTYRVNTVYV